MSFSVPQGKPGVQSTTYTAQPRDIFLGNGHMATFLPVPVTIDGTLSSNPSNTPYTWHLFAGMPFGMVSASKKFATSIMGATSAAFGGGQTTVSTDANTAAELNRRVGGSGTFTLTGPNVPGGTVRSRTITYSAVNTSTGAITVTADAAAAVSAVNQINSVITVDSSGSGTFTITVEGITTAAITYSATIATLITNINAQLNATFGTSAIVASGGSLAALILTFSGTGYSGRPVGTVQATLLTGATGFTMNGSGTVNVASTCPATTAGVTAVAADEGEFVTGSFIQPTDGSQTMITLLASQVGESVVDQLKATRVDVLASRMWAGGGIVNTGQIVGYPTDSALKTYLKNAIKATVPSAQFSDDFGV